VLRHLESRDATVVATHRFGSDLGPVYVANGVIGFVFATSGPLAIVLATGTAGGLSPDEIASWVFGAFALNGLLTVAMSWWYRAPLSFFWTIPGTVLVGQALQHLTFPQVLGSFYATGLLILLLGLSGWVRRAMAAVPMPIVMGMVAGVFLKFGLDLVRAVHQDAAIAAPMVLAFVALSAWPAAAKRLPPMIGALAVGVVAIAFGAPLAWPEAGGFAIVPPSLFAPAFSWPVMLELVVPLAITVLVVQNGQGFAVLKAAGHEPPVNVVTLVCGVASVATAFVGSVSTCLTGPTNAIVSSSGPRERHYAGAIVVGLLAVAFGAASSAFTAAMLAAPKAFVATLAGLAMLRVLHAAFSTAFRDRFPVGALASFLVTVADLPILGIGAPFWGLVVGIAVSWAMERGDFDKA
jgi:benzoate membrane transport protein